MYNQDGAFYYKVKNLKKYDEENKKLYIYTLSYGALLNNKVIIAKGKNLFRFRRCAWVYYPYLKILYDKLIFGDIEEYYEEMREAMTKKNYEYIDKNKYIDSHININKINKLKENKLKSTWIISNNY